MGDDPPPSNLMIKLTGGKDVTELLNVLRTLFLYFKN